MQAYTKSELPFLGVQLRPLREAARAAFRGRRLPSFEALARHGAHALARARYREERYAALQLAGEKAFAEHRTLAALPLYDELVVTGAWWDYVDWISTRHLRELHERFPEEARAAMLEWSRDPNLWKRRAAIISQIGLKEGTDPELLVAAIEGSIDDGDFFARKAIGWALREYSKTDGDWVRRYLAESGERLSSLSRREALKWLEHVHVPPRRAYEAVGGRYSRGK
jgi:3-methyladenine DNA glycosylase AlkD